MTLYWSLVCQVVLAQEPFKPYVRTFRVRVPSSLDVSSLPLQDDNGLLHMLPDDKKLPTLESIEHLVRQIFTDVGNQAFAHETLEMHFVRAS